MKSSTSKSLTPRISKNKRRKSPSAVLQNKRSLAFEAFRTALEDRLKKEGKVQVMPEKLKGFGSLS